MQVQTDPLRREQVLNVFCTAIEAKRDLLIHMDKREYAYSRIKGSVNVDLRKWHDLGPHLCSEEVMNIASTRGIQIDFSELKNGTQSKNILGANDRIQLEHVLPVDQIISMIMDTQKGDDLRELIKETSCTAWILESEDKKIREKSFRGSPKESYKRAGINLLAKSEDQWKKFDWEKVEYWSRNSH